MIQTAPVLLVLSFIVNTWLIFFVFKYNKKGTSSKIFLILSLSLFGWLITCSLAFQKYLLPSTNIFFGKLSIFFSIAYSLSFYFLAYYLIHNKLQIRRKNFVLLLTGVVIAYLVFTPYSVLGITVVDSIVKIEPGKLFFLFGGYNTFVVAETLIMLFRIKKFSNSNQKSQLHLFAWGILLFLILVSFTIFLPILFLKNGFFINAAPIYVLVFLFFTALAILKYQLFNIKFIAVEGLVILLDSFLAVQVLFASSAQEYIVDSFIFILGIFVSWILIKNNRRDLSRQKEIFRVEVLKESNQKLKELDRQKTEFLTIAAHQLRTPVSIINNYIALLQDGDYGLINEEIKNVLSNINKSSQWLVRLADEFMNIAHLEQGQTKYFFTNKNIWLIIKSVCDEFAKKASDKKIVFNFENPSLVDMIFIDEEKIRHVIFNFIDNAVKYGVLSEGDLEKNQVVRIVCLQKNGGVVFKVIDFGIGFDPEDGERFFKKFSRGENANSRYINTSSGLGLYIARMFVEGHGGTVWAHSPGLGRGSEFGFWIPYKQKKTSAEIVAPEPETKNIPTA